jgi:hypothetical protein
MASINSVFYSSVDVFLKEVRLLPVQRSVEATY